MLSILIDHTQRNPLSCPLLCLLPLSYTSRQYPNGKTSVLLGASLRNRKHMCQVPSAAGCNASLSNFGSQTTHAAADGPGWHFCALEVMTLGPVFLFADKLLIMSTAAFELQQQLDA